MGEYLNALVESEKFYILPICNLVINPFIPSEAYPDDEFWIEWNPVGYSVSTTTGGNLAQYNDNMEEIIITDYIKNLDVDYISFSSNPNADTTSSGQRISSVVFNIVYKLTDGINPFVTGEGTQIYFENEDEYICQCKVEVGALLKIDLKNIYSIRDIVITTTDVVPAPTDTADKNNKCRPYGITLWKQFLTSSSNNKNIFLQSNLLPAGYNEYFNPFYNQQP